MSKFLTLLLLVGPAALAMPHSDEYLGPWEDISAETPSSIIWPSISKAPVMMPRHHRPDHFGGPDDYPVQEVIHVHHMPVKIPLYAGIIIQDHQRRQSLNRDTCDATQGRGLQNLLSQAKALVPLSKIKEIITASITNDQQVQALVTLINSETYRAKVKELTQTRDFRVVVDYACKVLNLDVKDVWSFLKTFLGLSMGQLDLTTEFKGRAGIRGLLQDLRAALPRQELKDLYQKLMTTDEYLSKAIQQLKSSDFRQLLRNLINVPQYLEVREHLNNVGVPLQELKDLINTALGWSSDELEDSNEDLKI